MKPLLRQLSYTPFLVTCHGSLVRCHWSFVLCMDPGDRDDDIQASRKPATIQRPPLYESGALPTELLAGFFRTVGGVFCRVRTEPGNLLFSGPACGAWTAGIVPNKGAVNASQARPLNENFSVSLRALQIQSTRRGSNPR